jgi:hypothetical protein
MVFFPCNTMVTVAIILCAIFDTDNGATRWKEIFRRDCMEVGVFADMKMVEYVCCFPTGTSPKLFDKGGLGSKSYLHILKAEWFRLFDRIAELQHVTVPKRINGDHMVDDCYQRLKGELQKLTWPNTPILLNVDNNSVSSEDDSVIPNQHQVLLKAA